MSKDSATSMLKNLLSWCIIEVPEVIVHQNKLGMNNFKLCYQYKEIFQINGCTTNELCLYFVKVFELTGVSNYEDLNLPTYTTCYNYKL